MQNLNQAIKLTLILICLILIFGFANYSYSQVELPPREEFKKLTVNERALENNFEFTFDNNSSQTVQNFPLNKTGFVLHLATSPKIKDENTRIRIFSEDGKESEIFNFIDGSIFALILPKINHIIVQENKIDCSELAKIFNLDPSNTLCPDTISYKIYDNIVISKDTSYKIMLKNPTEFYQGTVVLADNTNFATNDNFKNVEITKGEEEANSTPQNISNLVKIGTFCIVSTKKTKVYKRPSKCTFESKNTQSVAKFQNDFINKTYGDGGKNIKFVLSYLPRVFDKSIHNYLFEYGETKDPTNKPAEINTSSKEKLFFDNYKNKIALNLGETLNTKSKITKTTFSITNSLELNKPLNKITFIIPLDELESIIKPYSDQSIESTLTNLSIKGSTKDQSSSFTISTDNNIVIKNLKDEEPAANTKLQTTVQPSELKITSYIPAKTFNISFSKKYSFVQETIAPTVGETGKTTQVINDKARADLVLIRHFNDINFLSSNSLNLTSDKASKLLENKSFTNQLSLSGFLIPPDFRPVLEEGYRAAISVSMTVNLNKNNDLEVIYSDIKTKDETPLTNFFKFTYLPLGIYDVNVKFDSDRAKFFEKAGIIKPLLK